LDAGFVAHCYNISSGNTEPGFIANPAVEMTIRTGEQKYAERASGVRGGLSKDGKAREWANKAKKSAEKKGYTSITKRFDEEVACPANADVPYWMSCLRPQQGQAVRTREDCVWADAYNIEQAELEFAGARKLKLLGREDRSYAYGAYEHIDAADESFHVYGLHKHQTAGWQDARAAKGKGKRSAPEEWQQGGQDCVDRFIYLTLIPSYLAAISAFPSKTL
jgi:hypothetical protein